MIIHQDTATQPYTRDTTLGNINMVETDNDDYPSKDESTVTMSEKNFKILMSLIPRTSEYNAVKNDIQRLKDKLTEMNFKTTAELNRNMLIKFLKDEYEYQLFTSDIIEFEKKTPRIVGRINLDDCKQETI